MESRRSKSFFVPAFFLAAATLSALLAFPLRAAAGTFELSLGASYSSSNYGGGNFNWSRRFGGSIGYYFFSVTEIELSYQDALERTKIVNFQDTTTHDIVLGLTIVQGLTPKSFPIQPYIKLGAGQLYREAQGSYSGGAAPPAILGSLTFIGGAGLKIYITRNFAIRGEATTYIAGGVLSTWQDNFALTGGISLML